MSNESQVDLPAGKPLSQHEKEWVIASVRDSPAIDTPHTRQARAFYTESAAGVLADLKAAGFDVSTVSELERIGRPYKDAVRVLVDWLPRVRYLPLAEELVRTLCVPFAKVQAVPVLLDMFRSTPDDLVDPMRPASNPKPMKEHLRWVIGLALGFHANPAMADQLIELASDRAYGEARGQIVLCLPKTKEPRVPRVLMSLLDDPTVRTNAIEALGKMKYAPAADGLKSMLTHDDKNVRDQAKKALRKIGP